MIYDIAGIEVIRCIQEYAQGYGLLIEAKLAIGLTIFFFVAGVISNIVFMIEFDEPSGSGVILIFLGIVVGVLLWMNRDALYEPDTPAIYEIRITDEISDEEYVQLTDEYDLSGPTETPIGETWLATQKLGN